MIKRINLVNSNIESIINFNYKFKLFNSNVVMYMYINHYYLMVRQYLSIIHVNDINDVK